MIRVKGIVKLRPILQCPWIFAELGYCPQNAQVKRKTWRFLCRSKYLCLSLGYCVCSLNVLSTFIPIKSESILSVCFVFINKKRTKRDGAKYMFIAHTTCNVFKRWQCILKIKRYLTNAPQQTILTRASPNPPPPCWAAIAKITAADWNKPQRQTTFLYAVVCAIIFPQSFSQGKCKTRILIKIKQETVFPLFCQGLNSLGSTHTLLIQIYSPSLIQIILAVNWLNIYLCWLLCWTQVQNFCQTDFGE